MFWGLSPGLDLQEEYLKVNKSCEFEDLNILIIGGCDIRHILKTLAQAHRHTKRKINIHIIEGCPELIMRQLLLLSIALESPLQLGLLEKTRLFMEIYGNTLLRPVASKYMIMKAKSLIKMITNLEYMSKKMPIVCLDKVKYRERDYMENILKFWQTGNTNLFNICDLWDRRIRSSLGVRYDYRHGAFDWDYNMRLKDVGGKVVASQEYKHFRSTGVAFAWLETEVCRPNNTLAAGIETIGENFYHKGYLGDIVTGPFVAYGLHCEDEEMLKNTHGTYMKRATDISERNLMRMFYELQTEEPFDTKIVEGLSEHNLGAVTIAELDAKLSEETTPAQYLNIVPLDLPCIEIDFATISFHSFSALDIYPDRADFNNKFNIIFISHNVFPRIKSSIVNMLEKDGLLCIEGRKFILDMKKDDINEFAKRIEETVTSWKCRLVEKFEPLKDDFAKVVKYPPDTV